MCEPTQALRSLAVLIRLLGRYVGNHVPHIMAVLTAALQGTPSPRVKMQVRDALHQPKSRQAGKLTQTSSAGRTVSIRAS